APCRRREDLARHLADRHVDLRALRPARVLELDDEELRDLLMAAEIEQGPNGQTDEPDQRFAVGTLREELLGMPTIQRYIVYVSGICLTFLLLQCFLVMPIILIKYGWGYSVGDG